MNLLDKISLALGGIPKEIEVLRLLRANECGMYGLELVKASEGRLKRGTIYVTLTRMEKKGLLKSSREPRPQDTPGAPIRVYRIEGQGVVALREWEAELPEALRRFV